MEQPGHDWAREGERRVTQIAEVDRKVDALSDAVKAHLSGEFRDLRHDVKDVRAALVNINLWIARNEGAQAGRVDLTKILLAVLAAAGTIFGIVGQMHG